jgi:dihydroorotate dehydrogenase (fumarate)
MDLSTTYMGLKLKNPLVPSASPLTADLDSIKHLAEAGAAAVVLHSLFEEQLAGDEAELVERTLQGTESFAESLTYFPEVDDFKLGPEEYLEHIRRAKAAVDIPIIASLNGATMGGWTDYAREMAGAGADAIELNIYYIATDPALSASDVENRYVSIVKAVKSVVDVPVAVKLSPFFSATAAMAHKLDEVGADGLVLFNRFYQPDIDLEQLEVMPDLVLSTPFEMRLPLRWIAILYGKVKASLGATTGIASGEDAIKTIMAGADIAQVCSVLLRKGADELTTIISDMQSWMQEHEYTSIEQMKGSMSQKACPDPAAFERANYLKTLTSPR